ncbi:RNA polymerase II subunit A C-terminal domain phosphatase SSU72 [Hesseltinella vesiculosa]|uniref:RNA polymerase II subunit A C-terminal domain phosphatase SSU72 n=1 Tax=Hesseltinella vesiculosa TaxID=101127 RepID=A0A1X2GI55_9FUNG|nr:RNA polymerase II subunit A C-terminal domain phosphatase SSU72 [Hesseltinella vesiculosa]
MVKYAVICASNQNRSMEAHYVLNKHGYNVSSFGTGTMVRLPGPAIDKPNIYPFGTPYDQVYQELKEQDTNLYTRNGLLSMLDRNRSVKTSPQKWHEQQDQFDVIITCEERCYDAVVEDLENRGQNFQSRTHVINVDIKDNHEDAAIGGQAILKLVRLIEDAQNIDADIPGIMQTFRKDHPNLPVLYSANFF